MNSTTIGIIAGVAVLVAAVVGYSMSPKSDAYDPYAGMRVERKSKRRASRKAARKAARKA
jgi:hypothetical protein